MRVEAEFVAEPTSVTRARRFIAGAIGDIPDDASEAVLLIASELASNSVRHAASTFRVRIERLPDHIRLEVEDEGGGQPTIKSPTVHDTSGRGLQIVAALADHWGVVPVPETTGKIVWATIPLHAPGADLDRKGQVLSQPRRRRGRRFGGAPSDASLRPLWNDWTLLFV
jgi:anti-sigma regulatory factor (Ser/Thr protein kinase)